MRKNWVLPIFILIISGCTIHKNTSEYFLKGLNACELKDYKSAINLFTKSLSYEKSAKAFYNRGVCYYELDMHSEAISDFRNAARLAPDEFIIYNQIALNYHEIGNIDSAIAYYSKSIDLNNNSVNLILERGSLYMECRSYGKAILDFSKAIEIDNQSFNAYYSRALCYHKLGLPERSVTDYSKAIEIDSNYYYAYVNRGVNFIALNKPSDAYYDLIYASHLCPDSALPHIKLAYLYMLENMPDSAKAEVDKGIVLKYDLIDKNMILGIVNNATHKPEEAIKNFQILIDADTFVYLSYLNLVISSLLIEDSLNSFRCLDSAFKHGDRNEKGFVCAFRAFLFTAMEDYDQAAAEKTKATDYGFDYSKDGEKDEVMVFLKTFINENSGNSREPTYQAENYMRRVEELDDLIKNNPDSIELFIEKGKLLFTFGQYPKAEKAFDIVIRKDSLNAYAYFCRAKIKYLDGRYKSSIKDISVSIRLNFDLYKSLVLRGDCKESINDYFGAVQDYTKAVEINSGDPELFLKRGIVYKYMNLTAKACADFRKAYEMGNSTASFYMTGCE